MMVNVVSRLLTMSTFRMHRALRHALEIGSAVSIADGSRKFMRITTAAGISVAFCLALLFLTPSFFRCNGSAPR